MVSNFHKAAQPNSWRWAEGGGERGNAHTAQQQRAKAKSTRKGDKKKEKQNKNKNKRRKKKQLRPMNKNVSRESTGHSRQKPAAKQKAAHTG